MRIYVLLVAVLCAFPPILAQDDRKNFDFVIEVDGQLVESITRPKIIVMKDSQLVKEIPVGYHPGNLWMSFDDFNSYFMAEGNELFFQFYYYQYPPPRRKQILYQYEIEMRKFWLNSGYLVLQIYNLDKAKYTRKNSISKMPLSRKRGFYYDLMTSNGQIMRRD